ncbi:hypothetical protein AB7849_19310 [Rhodanobacter sp. 115]|uniref:hypothetical protein n=1 Tax=Rhodanobacter sp. FW021-MT20 TaxID=1162282 RepID=UPI0034E398E3
MGANRTALKVAITYYGQPGLGVDPEAVAESLQQLAGKHLQLTVKKLNGVDGPHLDEGINAVEAQIEEVVEGIPGIERVDFNGDPRGDATVSLVFTSGQSNGFSTGLWKIFQD